MICSWQPEKRPSWRPGTSARRAASSSSSGCRPVSWRSCSWSPTASRRPRSPSAPMTVLEAARQWEEAKRALGPIEARLEEAAEVLKDYFSRTGRTSYRGRVGYGAGPVGRRPGSEPRRWIPLDRCRRVDVPGATRTGRGRPGRRQAPVRRGPCPRSGSRKQEPHCRRAPGKWASSPGPWETSTPPGPTSTRRSPSLGTVEPTTSSPRRCTAGDSSPGFRVITTRQRRGITNAYGSGIRPGNASFWQPLSRRLEGWPPTRAAASMLRACWALPTRSGKPSATFGLPLSRRRTTPTSPLLGRRCLPERSPLPGSKGQVCRSRRR